MILLCQKQVLLDYSFSARCPTSWVEHGNSSYYINDTPTLKCSELMQEYGGNLPIIKSAYEDSFLLDLIKSQTTVTPRGAWIGLIRKAADFKFYWIDDTPLERQYKAWAQGEPNNAGSKENCANHYANTNAGK